MEVNIKEVLEALKSGKTNKTQQLSIPEQTGHRFHVKPDSDSI